MYNKNVVAHEILSFSLSPSPPVPIPGGTRRQQLRFSPYVGTSNRNRIGEKISASRDQELQVRARPQNKQDQNQAVDLQVISVWLVFFSNSEWRRNLFPTTREIITFQCFVH